MAENSRCMTFQTRSETAIHLVDHQANLALSAEFGEYYVRLPITDTAHIVVDNALRIDWNDVLPATDCNYILGNPPFSGQGKMVGDQSDDLDLIWGSKRSRYLDYVTGWYAKTRQYVGDRPIKVAFVRQIVSVKARRLRRCGSRSFLLDSISTSPTRHFYGRPKHRARLVCM
jgi:hypothetical protein